MHQKYVEFVDATIYIKHFNTWSVINNYLKTVKNFNNYKHHLFEDKVHNPSYPHNQDDKNDDNKNKKKQTCVTKFNSFIFFLYFCRS